MPLAKRVKKVTKFSDGFYVEWMNEKFGTDYRLITELGDGYTYCQLLSKIFPNHIKVSSLKKGNAEKNWKKIDHCLKRVGICKTIKTRELMAENIDEHTFFAAWFKEFYEKNETEDEKLEYLLRWVSKHSSTNVRNLDELSNGINYGLLLWRITPKALKITDFIPSAACSDVKSRKKNLTVLKRALKRFKITVPVDALSKLEPEACLEFLLLFKKFYDMSPEVLKGKLGDQRRRQMAVADTTYKIVDAATSIQKASVTTTKYVLNSTMHLFPKVGAVKMTNSGVGELFRTVIEKYEEAVNPQQPKYLQYEFREVSQMHDILVIAKVINSMSKCNKNIVPKDMLQLARSIILGHRMANKYLIKNLFQAHDVVEKVVVHKSHPLKDLFYSMKMRLILAVEGAQEQKRLPSTKASDGRATKMWYVFSESKSLADGILDHVDFMQRGRTRLVRDDS